MGSGALEQRREDIVRVIQNMEVQKIETICEMVQTQVSNLREIVITKSTDSKNRWIGPVVIGEINCCWMTEVLLNSRRKCLYSLIRLHVLAENVKNILRQQERSHQIIRPKYRISTILRHHKETSRIRVEDLRGENDD